MYGRISHIDFDNKGSIENALSIMQESKAEKREVNFYGDGHAAEKIVDYLEEVL